MDLKRIASLEQSRKPAIAGDHDLEHVGAIAAGIIGPLLVQRALEQAFRNPAIVSIRVEFRTVAVELAA